MSVQSRVLKFCRYIVLTIATLIAVLFFLIIAIPLGIGIYDYFALRGEVFTKEEWTQALRSGKTCSRGKMVADLKKHYLKPAMNKSEVIALLGPPHKPGYTPHCLSYLLGDCRVSLMNWDILDICFNETDKLTTIDVSND